MPSLEEFKTLLAGDLQKALREYIVESDETLDFVQGAQSVDWLAPRKVNVAFDLADPNFITMRAARTGEAYDEIWYLPWKSGFVTGTTLDGTVPRYFSTSQLSGCRFSLQFEDGTRKKVTVLHGAGDLTREAREKGEAEELGKLRYAGPMRRYSATRGSGGLKAFVKDGTRLVYEGDKAWIFGVRSTTGEWSFYAQEQTKARKFVGIKPLE